MQLSRLLIIVAFAASVAFSTLAKAQPCLDTYALEGQATAMSVAAGGEWIAAGDPYAMDEIANGHGLVRVFQSSLKGLQLTHTIVAPDGATGDFFGAAVLIDDDVMFVGAPRVGPSNTGAVYLYRLIDNDWLFDTKFTPDDPECGYFGSAMDRDGGLLLIGAPESTPGGVEGGGAAYLYQFDGATPPSQLARINHPTPSEEDWFGEAVAVESSTILLGAGEFDGPGTDSGAAFFFELVNGQPEFRQEIVGGNTNLWDRFGGFGGVSPDHSSPNALDLRGDLAIVGASRNGYGGAAYIFRRLPGGIWIEAERLIGESEDGFFGKAVAFLDNDDVVVTATSHDTPGAAGAGTARVFRREVGTWDWIPGRYVMGRQDSNWCHFGWTVAGLGDEFIVPTVQSGCGAVHRFDLELQTECDCNGNGQDDYTDIVLELSYDSDHDGIPNECDCAPDLNLDGEVEMHDLLAMLGSWGFCVGCPADLNENWFINLEDLLILLSEWGPCTN